MLLIGTYSGMLDADNPDAYAFGLAEIAYSLATIQRFNGHRGPMSVAAHSVTVARRAYERTGDPLVALLALHHDSSEAYLGDVIGPVRRALSKLTIAYETWHTKVSDAICAQLLAGLPWGAATYKHRNLIEEIDKAHGMEQLKSIPRRDYPAEWMIKRDEADFSFAHSQYRVESDRAYPFEPKA